MGTKRLMSLVVVAALGCGRSPAVEERAAALGGTFVQVGWAAPQSPQSSVAVPLPAAQGAGHLLVAVVGWSSGSGTVTSVTDSRGDAWVLAVGPTRRTTVATQYLYYARGVAAGANTVTAHLSAAVPFPDVRVLEYSGADAPDGARGASGSGTLASTGSLATTNASDLLVAGATVSTHDTGPGSGFTSRVITSPDGDVAEDRQVSAVGSYAATAPLTSGQWVIQVAAFRATSAPPDAGQGGSGGTGGTGGSGGAGQGGAGGAPDAGSGGGVQDGPQDRSGGPQDVAGEAIADRPVDSPAGADGPADASAPPDAGCPTFPLRASADHRRLETPCGVPFLIRGDQAWELVTSTTPAEAEQYLENRRQKGFNTVLARLISNDPYTPFPPGGENRDDQQPFAGYLDMSTTPTEAYFAYADQVVRLAESKGMLVLLFPTYLGFEGSPSDGWWLPMNSAGSAGMGAWGRYLGARYASFPNVLWVDGGDFVPPDHVLVDAYVAGMQAAGDRHLRAAHASRGISSAAAWGSESWLTVDGVYSSFVTYAETLAEYHRAPVRPVFLLDAQYENENQSTRQRLRAQAYGALLSGAAGAEFGNNPIWHFASPGNPDNPAPYSWQVAMDADGSRDASLAWGFFSSRRWDLLVPDDAHQAVTSGLGSFGDEDYAPAARASDGSLVAAYAPSARTLAADLSRLSGPVTARWFDPAAGTYQVVPGSPFANSGSRSFATPGARGDGTSDWVLVLEAGP